MKGKIRKKSKKFSIFLILTIFVNFLIIVPIISGDDQIVFSFDPNIQNIPPNQPTNPTPSNGATGQDLTVTLSVFATDDDGDPMNVFFYKASDNSLIGIDTVPNGTYANCTWSSLQSSTTYTWYAVANDSEYENTSQTWSFKTKSSSSPSPPYYPPNQKPIANITGPEIDYENETVIFSGHYSTDPDGTIVGYRWDFDNDGIFDTDWLEELLIAHTFPGPGNYTVVLEVKDNDGATATTEFYILIVTMPPELERPVPNIGGPYKGNVNGPILFNASDSYDPDGDIVYYKWDFGDKNISLQKNPEHAYSEPGNYIVILTVTDNDGLISKSITTVYIREPLGDDIIRDKEEGQPLMFWFLGGMIFVVILFIVVLIQKRREVDYLIKNLDEIKKIEKTKTVTSEAAPKIETTGLRGTPVVLKATQEIIGNVDNEIYDENKKIIGYKIRCKESKKILNLPLNLFDKKDYKLEFVPDRNDNITETLSKLEFKEVVSPELALILTDTVISDDEFYKLFVKDDAELATLLKEAVLLKKSVNNRLAILKKQRNALEDTLYDLRKKNPSDRSDDEKALASNLIDNIITLNANIDDCEKLLQRLQQTSFVDLHQKDVNL